MQGNSLNAELLDAFPNLDERMTASAYEQAKGKLKPEIFEHILKEYLYSGWLRKSSPKSMPIFRIYANKKCLPKFFYLDRHFLLILKFLNLMSLLDLQLSQGVKTSNDSYLNDIDIIYGGYFIFWHKVHV